MNKRTIVFLHVALWAFVFISPLPYLRSSGFSLLHYVMNSMSPLLMMVVFYMNYLWLTPKYFGTDKYRYYWLVNVLMVTVLGIFLHYWMAQVHLYFDTPPQVKPRYPRTIDAIIFILRDIYSLAVSAAVATAVILAMKWQHNEDARLKAEAARADAELSNLRSQINPHFLLNTLNNIYALTTFDAARAQEAIQQLSKLLRHLLYDNQEQLVNLSDEVLFLENYISLMKIRLTPNVDVTVNVDIPKEPVKVAPLVAVSLIENAFKHGVSPTEPSFIHISITADKTHVVADIRNSNHPKAETDRSGHGIGLQQVQRRLDLNYPGHYQWQRGVSEDGKIYSSTIKIEL